MEHPDAGCAGQDMTSPVWAEIDRIREDTLWSLQDLAVTANSLTRLTVAATWMLLAWTVGAELWWGVGLLAASALSLLHARRRTVLLLADSAGPLAPFVRWLLPYPRVPHVSPIGVMEGIGAALAAAGTGWIGNAFAVTERTRTAAPLAIALIYLFEIAVVVNIDSHVAWLLGPVGGFFAQVRPYLSVICAAAALALLWPSHSLGTAYPAVELTVVAGTAAMVLSGWVVQAVLRSTARLASERVGSIRRAVQAVDGQYVHQLKNMARILYRRSDEITPGDLRERVRRLSVAISSTEQLFKSGRGLPARCVEDVVNGLLGLDERLAALRNVVADLDPRELTPGDAELVRIAVGDLCSNAVNADASEFWVGLRAEPAEHGCWLTLEAECCCGASLPDIPEDSSLMRLAALLHYNRGTFVISDDAGRHRFTLRWPSTSQPRQRPDADRSEPEGAAR